MVCCAVLCLVAQSCPTLCDLMDCSTPGSSVHGDSPRQEYWSGLPFPSLGDLPNPGIIPESPAFQANTLLSEPPGKQKQSSYPMLKVRKFFLKGQGVISLKYSHQGR